MANVKEVKAVAKEVSQSPRKVGLVASLVRGRTVADAIVILEHTPKRAALAVKKTIESAAANATNNHSLDKKTLKIESIQVGHGTRLKRFKPVARGQAHPFQKRTSNIRVVVTGSEKVKKKPAAKAAAKSTSKESK